VGFVVLKSCCGDRSDDRVACACVEMEQVAVVDLAPREAHRHTHIPRLQPETASRPYRIALAVVAGIDAPEGTAVSPPRIARIARHGQINIPSPTPSPIARPFLFWPSAYSPPRSTTGFPSTSTVDKTSTVISPGRPTGRARSVATLTSTGAPRAITISPFESSTSAATDAATRDVRLCFEAAGRSQPTPELMLAVERLWTEQQPSPGESR
jgi:hypothetical protein